MAKAERKRQPPRFVPLEQLSPPVAQPALVPLRPGGPQLVLFRRQLVPFEILEPPGKEAQKGPGYWLTVVRNENTEQEYAGHYVVLDPNPKGKSKWPPWTPQELAIFAAKKLSEYRGLVALQRFEGGLCVFAAVFASNSLWTFCLWSTDAARCPAVKPYPEGWRPGQPLPEGLVRRKVSAYPPPDCHHPERGDPARSATFCKLAQKAFA